jgi:hypothetical protein
MRDSNFNGSVSTKSVPTFPFFAEFAYVGKSSSTVLGSFISSFF